MSSLSDVIFAGSDAKLFNEDDGCFLYLHARRREGDGAGRGRKSGDLSVIGARIVGGQVVDGEAGLRA